jgi:uncharacterized membrane protein YcaP (DUF421 family)
MVTQRAEDRNTKPPEPPSIDRRLQLRPIQLIGFSVLALLPLLAAVGVFGEEWMRAARETAPRIAFVYFFLMVALRVMGKREMSEMSPFELITLLFVPEIFSAALAQGEYTMTHATMGVATLLSLVSLTSLATFRSQRLERLVEGQPSILVHDGQFLERNLKRERVTPEEVFTEMHKVGVERLAQVQWAILEVDGRIAIIRRDRDVAQQPDKKRHA